MSFSAITLVQNIQLPNVVAVQYTAPANSKVIIRHAVFTNTTAGAVTVTSYIIPNGGSVTDAGKIEDATSIGGHTPFTSPNLAGCVLNQGDTLQCFASAATSISMNVSGILQQ